VLGANETFIHNIDHSPHCTFVENLTILSLQKERVEKIEGEGRVMEKKVNESWNLKKTVRRSFNKLQPPPRSKAMLQIFSERLKLVFHLHL
jgi:hypothetical protein